VKGAAVDGISAMVGYVYDADGNRVAKGPITAWSCDPTTNGFESSAYETDYVLNQSGQTVTETTKSDTGVMQWNFTNVYANGVLFATYDAQGLHFLLNDWLGTRRASTDYEGVLESLCASLPYGDGLNCTNSPQSPNEQHFTGKQHDQESGNDYFGARYYSENDARFMSPDWSAKVEPVPYAKLGDPQSLNLYGYMLNNPLGGVDADGHLPQCDVCRKLINWLSSSHSASASASVSGAQGSAGNGFISGTGKAGTAQASASASYGLNTSSSAKASASVAEATLHEGTHSTTQMNSVTANAGASVGVSLGGKSGVGISASAGANADVLRASQSETITLGPVTITGGASGAVGIGADASANLGASGFGASAEAVFGYGGGLTFNVSWGGVTGTAGASVKGDINSTTTTIQKPEVQPQ